MSSARLKADQHDIFSSGLASPSHALLACKRMQMVNRITVCNSLGGMLDTTDLSLPSGMGSGPMGKSSRSESLVLCWSAQQASHFAYELGVCVPICDWLKSVVIILSDSVPRYVFIAYQRDLGVAPPQKTCDMLVWEKAQPHSHSVLFVLQTSLVTRWGYSLSNWFWQVNKQRFFQACHLKLV